MSPGDAVNIGWFATKGTGTNEAKRMSHLLSRLPLVTELEFSKAAKLASFFNLVRVIRRLKPKLIVMEGTGLAGGLACLLSKLLWQIPYVFSSGDAVGPFIASHVPIAGAAAGVYERILCRAASGFIGWTPYLSGRAMTFGTPRAMTAAGWALESNTETDDESVAMELRRKWQIPDGVLVVGILGALDWNRHRQYCYGLELVRCAQKIRRKDVIFLIVGDGTGMSRLRDEAGSLLGSRIFLPGAVPLREVIPALSLMDVASLPQSMDGVGLFRFTTKVSEYAEARLPVITSKIPMAYDIGLEWMWRLPGNGPWEETYVQGLITLLETLTSEEIEQRRNKIPKTVEAFQGEPQVRRVTEFIQDILAKP